MNDLTKASIRKLQIDEKWTVAYDTAENDRPVAWFRHEKPQSDFDENNAVVAMFYALLAAHNEGAKLSAWQCVFHDGKTGLYGDEYGNQFCAMQRRAEKAEARLTEIAARMGAHVACT